MLTSTSDAGRTDDRSVYRLPTAVRPSHYRLTLEPDLSAATFTGEVWIELDVREATASIVLNAA